MEKLFYAKVEVPSEFLKNEIFNMNDIKHSLAMDLMGKIKNHLVVSEEMRSNCDKVIYETKIRVDFCDTDYSSWEISGEGR